MSKGSDWQKQTSFGTRERGICCPPSETGWSLEPSTAILATLSPVKVKRTGTETARLLGRSFQVLTACTGLESLVHRIRG
jgi:hypothetical protein